MCPAENVELEILEDELVRDDLNTGSAGDNPDLDLLDDFEAEISFWEDVNELVETYHVPTVEEIIHNVAVGTDMDDSESEDEQLQGESECDDDVLEVGAAVVGVSEPNDPVKLADIVLVDEIEKLIDQLYMRSWTRAEDTQSVQNILGVIIDNKLSWIPHINKLHKKLKSASGLLKRISSIIPKEYYKSLYYALF